MAKVFLTCKFKLRAPTGRKERVLAEVQRLYKEAVVAVLAQAKTDLPRLSAMPPDQRAKRGLEKAITMTADMGSGLHSSLRNAVKLAVSAAVESYLSLNEQAEKGEGEMPAWPGDAQNGWPDYEAILDEIAVLADNEEREAELRNQLGMAAFRAKAERRGLGDVLWFPAMDAPYRSHYGGLLTDGKNWFAMVYVLAPDHPMAKQIKGDGTLSGPTGEHTWKGRSKCALILPLETDRHDWQHERFLNAFCRGDASVQTAQLYRERTGGWSFAVQSAWKREIGKPEHYLGLAFEGVWPVLATSEGMIIQLAGSELQDVAKLALLLRSAAQRQGKDISYMRVHATTSKQVVHLWANAILTIAKNNGCGVALAGGGRPILGVPRDRLAQVLGYKGVLASLPVRHVSIKGLAWVCPRCGAEMVKPEQKPWPAENECACGQVSSVGTRIAWHAAKRAEEKWSTT